MEAISTYLDNGTRQYTGNTNNFGHRLSVYFFHTGERNRTVPIIRIRNAIVVIVVGVVVVAALTPIWIEVSHPLFIKLFCEVILSCLIRE